MMERFYPEKPSADALWHETRFVASSLPLFPSVFQDFALNRSLTCCVCLDTMEQHLKISEARRRLEGGEIILWLNSCFFWQGPKNKGGMSTVDQLNEELFGDSTVLCEPILCNGAMVGIVQCFREDQDNHAGSFRFPFQESYL